MPLTRQQLLLQRIDYGANLPRCKVLYSISDPNVYSCLEPGHADAMHATRSGQKVLEWSSHAGLNSPVNDQTWVN